MLSEVSSNSRQPDQPAAIILTSYGGSHPRENNQMVAWGLVGRKPQKPQKVTTGRFEMERDGEVAFLEYSMTGNVLELIHTEVPSKLRGLGLASLLAENALQFARENNLKVDVICPSVQEYLAKHPEYSDLVMH